MISWSDIRVASSSKLTGCIPLGLGLIGLWVLVGGLSVSAEEYPSPSQVKGIISRSGVNRVMGYVSGSFVCPRCPDGALCEPCPSSSVFLSDQRMELPLSIEASSRTDTIVLETQDPGVMEFGVKYRCEFIAKESGISPSSAARLILASCSREKVTKASVDDEVERRFADKEHAKLCLSEMRGALESFRRFTEIFRRYSKSSDDPSATFARPSVPVSARYSICAENLNLLDVGNLDWDVQTIGFANWADAVAGYLAFQDSEIARLRLENGKLSGLSKKELTELNDKFREATQKYNDLLDLEARKIE